MKTDRMISIVRSLIQRALEAKEEALVQQYLGLLVLLQKDRIIELEKQLYARTG